MSQDSAGYAHAEFFSTLSPYAPYVNIISIDNFVRKEIL